MKTVIVGDRCFWSGSPSEMNVRQGEFVEYAEYERLERALEEALHRVYDGSAPDDEVDQLIAREIKAHKADTP